SIGNFKVDDRIPTIANSFTYCRDKLARLRKMLEYMATDDQIGRFRCVLSRVIVSDKSNIIGYIISRFGLIAWTEADPKVVPAIAYDAKEVPRTSANFNYAFLMKVIGSDQVV